MRATGVRGVLGFALGAVLACALPGHERRVARALEVQAGELAAALSASATAAEGLQVRLAFPARADLDLYVTDPAQETVYYGHYSARSGGSLDHDLRCDAPAPRFETVTFPKAPRGRYRVGVDFGVRCDRSLDPVPFAVELRHGDRREQRRGAIRFGQFQAIVLEFDVQ